VRQNNEDQFLIAELTKSMRVRQTTLREPHLQVGDERAHLFLVADGMGGERAGERASALAVTAIEQFTLNTFKWFLGSDNAEAKHALGAFQTALNHADARVFDEAAEHPELEGMGTTLTMAFHLGTQLCVVHVGDTRAYVYRNAELHQLTEDHTIVADMVRNGTVDPGAAARHPLRHVITNVIGGRDRGVRVEARSLELQAGDYLVLCSDGLTEMVPSAAIAGILSAHDEPKATATQLVEQANDSGGRDNITVIVVRFDGASQRLERVSD
jgi:protein phosphatase